MRAARAFVRHKRRILVDRPILCRAMLRRRMPGRLQGASGVLGVDAVAVLVAEEQARTVRRRWAWVGASLMFMVALLCGSMVAAYTGWQWVSRNAPAEVIGALQGDHPGRSPDSHAAGGLSGDDRHPCRCQFGIGCARWLLSRLPLQGKGWSTPAAAVPASRQQSRRRR